MIIQSGQMVLVSETTVNVIVCGYLIKLSNDQASTSKYTRTPYSRYLQGTSLTVTPSLEYDETFELVTMAVYNPSTTSTTEVTMSGKKTGSTSTVPMYVITMKAGGTLHYSDENGFVYDA